MNDSFPKSFLVFSGPSGAGKSTLLNRLFSDFPTTFGFSVSRKKCEDFALFLTISLLLILIPCLDTTRQPRTGEKDGVDYNYVSEDNFKSLITDDSFLEYANFSGNWYGTTWTAINKIKEAGKICILDVDLAGVKSIKAHIKSATEKSEAETVKSVVPQARFVFVRPPCKLNLEARLRGRGSETEESLSRRLARVDGDFEYADKPGNYDLNLVNDEFDSAYAQLVSFIFEIKSGAVADDAHN